MVGKTAAPAEKPPSGPAPDQIQSARQFRRFALAVAVVGVLVQLALSTYYLSVGHSPAPHGLPVGVVASADEASQLTAQLEADGAFSVTTFDNAASLEEAMLTRDIYGGVDLFAQAPRLFVATAAGPNAATLLRNTFTTVVQQQVAEQVQALAGQGATVPVSVLESLTTPPRVIDVVPLPADDRAGASIGFLVQALAFGGTVASVGLGRLIPRTRRSYRRGIGHAVTLVVYAAGSAAAVLWVMSWFGVGAQGHLESLYIEFSLLSLAITASTAAAVALVGEAGALVGLLYFTVGLVISGTSIVPEFLPTVGRRFGQALPTGAGATAIRESLYFPAASTTAPLTVLALYAVLGVVIVLVTNVLPNRSGRKSEVNLRGGGAGSDADLRSDEDRRSSG